MDNIREKIEQLTRRINELSQQQTHISRQLIQMINELDALKQQVAAQRPTEEIKPAVPEKIIEFRETIEAPVRKPASVSPSTNIPATKTAPQAQKSASTLEEYLGKNIASKAGILITIVGIFFGSRYAIEHNLVSPEVRIISGYISGLALVALAIWLKKKYEAYSAVLMGGGLSVLYFITYIAYGVYGLWPQWVAFAFMLVFTAVTVYAALLYNRVIIAHLALVGAYAIPFLLSDNSGRFYILFSYMAVINAGILVLSFRKYWKSLFYAAFIITWLIYAGWYVMQYHEAHFQMALLFLAIFFITFYGTFLSYKLVKKEQYGFSDIAILLSNAFIFYGLGSAMLNESVALEDDLGLFTVINAVIHFVVSLVIRRLRLTDRSLYYLVLGLVIVFLTIAVPVQFDGNWVTLLWAAEAVLVFIIGRTRQAAAYEKLGAGLVVLSFVSLLEDWFSHLTYNVAVPFANITFITGILVLLALGTILYFSRTKKYNPVQQLPNLYRQFYDYVVPALFLVCSYFVFQLEIRAYFLQVQEQVRGADGSFAFLDGEVNAFAFVVLLLYTMLFVTLLLWINRRWIKNTLLATAGLIGTLLVTAILLLQGLVVLNELAEGYYRGQGNGFYFGGWNAGIRYLVMAATLLLFYTARQSLHTFIKEVLLLQAGSIIIHVAALCFLSSEYLYRTTISGADNQYRLGLSILWGVYALALIIYGIWKKQKHLRLAAIVIFIVTLVKLFFYDLAESGTITKTVSFISLGIILLLVSYLYNRYKELLFGNDEAGGVK